MGTVNDVWLSGACRQAIVRLSRTQHSEEAQYPAVNGFPDTSLLPLGASRNTLSRWYTLCCLKRRNAPVILRNLSNEH